MSKIVIKKRISLDFIGSDYSEAYIEFKTIPMREYEKYAKEASNNKDESKAVSFIMDTLKELFISGKFPDEKGELFELSSEDIEDLDVNTVVTVFKILTGQDQSPN